MTLSTRFAHMMIAGAMAAGAVFGSETATRTDSIADAARKTQAEAREISVMLKAKKPDFDAVRSRMATLETHWAEVRQQVQAMEPAMADASESRKAEFQRVKELSQLVAIFLENKKSVLNSGRAEKNRALLKAKAEGIAQRAELLHRSALRLKG